MKDRLTSQPENVPTAAAREIFGQLRGNGYSCDQIVAVANQLIMLAGAEMTEKFGPDLGAGFSDYDLTQLGMPSDN